MKIQDTATLGSAKALPQSHAGLWWGLLGVVAFSFTVPFTRVAVENGHMSPLFVGSGRAVIAALLAAAALILTRQALPRGKQWIQVAVVAGGAVVGFPLLTSFALTTAPASHGAVVIALLPAATAVCAVLRTGERPARSFWIAAGCGAIASAIFARRLAYGYSTRDLKPLWVEWDRRILAATHGLTSPKCARLRMQALWYLESNDPDASGRAAAEAQLERELEGNYADYAIVFRALLAEEKAFRLEPGPQKIAAFERAFELHREAVDNDEYEQHDWPGNMRNVAAAAIKECAEITDCGNLSGAEPESIDRDNLASMLLAAERYLDVLPPQIGSAQVEILGPYLLDELRPMVPLLDGDLRARTTKVIDRISAVLQSHDPGVYEVMDVHARFMEAAVVFRGGDDTWRARGVDMFTEAFALGAALIEHGFGDAYRLAARCENRSNWLFMRCEAWESGTQDGQLRPYTLTTRAALAYLRHGFARLRDDSGGTLNSFARMAAHPGCFLTSEQPDEAREFYELLLPLLDPQRDGAETIAKVKQQAKQSQKPGKKRGWFR